MTHVIASLCAALRSLRQQARAPPLLFIPGVFVKIARHRHLHLFIYLFVCLLLCWCRRVLAAVAPRAQRGWGGEAAAPLPRHRTLSSPRTLNPQHFGPDVQSLLIFFIIVMIIINVMLYITRVLLLLLLLLLLHSLTTAVKRGITAGCTLLLLLPSAHSAALSCPAPSWAMDAADGEQPAGPRATTLQGRL